MPVYHFILHAYGTWHPDHEDGWHQHGISGALRSEPMLGQWRREHQKWPSVTFSSDIQTQLIKMVLDICGRRSWRCHAAAVNETHIHMVVSWRVVVSWRGSEIGQDVRATLKRLLGLRMAELHNEFGRAWFSKGGKPRRVEDEEHLKHLCQEYLLEQGGTLWREGDAGPESNSR